MLLGRKRDFGSPGAIADVAVGLIDDEFLQWIWRFL